ncbi:hypothetical protein D3C71_1704720 [compost metagenome]
MRPEVVVLHDASPVRIDHPLAILFRPNAVFPVVFVCKTAPRPAQNRNIQILQRGQNVIPHAVRIPDRRILAHPDAFINTAAQMLGELPVYVPVNLSFSNIGIDDHLVPRHP